MSNDKTTEAPPTMQYPRPRVARPPKELPASGAKPSIDLDPALAVACPHCDKAAGYQCVSSNGNPAATHKARLEAYKATLNDPE